MRQALLNYIRCPICSKTNFDLTVTQEDELEVREGYVTCAACDHSFSIRNGIVDLMPNPSKTIQNEQQGWSELLGETSEDLVDTMLKLPHYDEDELWINVAINFDGIMQHVDLRGKRVLDIGAGRCWSTRHIMLRGAQEAVGLDILTQRFIGLETADIYLAHDDIYFERVIGDMNSLPFRPASFDIVFMTATLHHTSNPGCAMQEVAKVLEPGGIAILINEPVRSLRQTNSLENCVEIEHGINENIYSIQEYLDVTSSAGLKPKLYFPHTVEKQIKKNPTEIMRRFGRVGKYILQPLWQVEAGRRLLTGPLLRYLYLIASMPLSMVAHKPL